MSKKTKEEEAIGILWQQLEKLDDTSINPEPTWRIQTEYYIKQYLGEESPQYKFIKEFKFRHDPERTSVYVAKNFIKATIDIIQRTGLHKPDRVNIFYRMEGATLLGTIVVIVLAVMGAGITVGKYLSDVQNIEIKQSLKEKTEILDKLRDSVTTVKNMKAAKPLSDTTR